MSKKFLSLALALVMCLGLTVPAFAEPAFGGAGIGGNGGIPKEERLKADVILEGYLRTEYVKIDENSFPMALDENSFLAVQVVKDGSNVRVECPGVEQLVDKERSLAVVAYEYADTGLYGSMWWDSPASFLDGVGSELGPEFQVDTSPKTFAATSAAAPKFIFAIVDDNDYDGYSSYVEVEESVYWMSESGYAQLAPEFKGTPGPGSKIIGTVGPDKPTQPTDPTVGGFTDVKTGDYFAEPVLWAVEKGITAGTSETTFSPNENCSVAQILSFLWRANGSPKPTTANPFSDVKSGDYYADAAAWAYEKGMVSGTAFGGNTPCTRSMAVTYMWKAAGSPSAKAASFADVSAGADYAQAVAWAVEQKITSGTSATTFSPDSVCTRGQIVSFLYRGLEK